MATDLSEDAIHVPGGIMETLRDDLEDKVRDGVKKGRDRGLAIVIGNREGNGVPGVDKDVEVMCKEFSQQGLTVWDMMDVSSVHIAGVILAVAKYDFPPSYDRFMFYYCGRGGSKDGQPYVCATSQGDEEGKEDVLSIEGGILSPLRRLQRLEPRFVFDCCPHGNTVETVAQVDEDTDSCSDDNRCEVLNEIFSRLDRRITCSFSSSSRFRTRQGGRGGGIFTQLFSKHTSNLWNRPKPGPKSGQEPGPKPALICDITSGVICQLQSDVESEGMVLQVENEEESVESSFHARPFHARPLHTRPFRAHHKGKLKLTLKGGGIKISCSL